MRRSTQQLAMSIPMTMSLIFVISSLCFAQTENQVFDLVMGIPSNILTLINPLHIQMNADIKLGNYAEVESCARKALAIYAVDGFAMRCLAESLDWQGKQEDALKAYHDLVYSPNQMVYQSADLGTYLQYVIALIKSKEWELAVTIYEVVKYPPMRLAMFPFPWGTFDPKKPDYIRLQAICHLVLGAQHRRSYRSLPTGYELDHLEAALRLQPKMAEAHYFYAVELTRLKRDFEAKAAFERAATLGNKTVKAAALEKLTKLKLSNKY